MNLHYATPPAEKPQGHTGSPMPMLDFGPGAEDSPAVIEQISVFEIKTTTVSLR